MAGAAALWGTTGTARSYAPDGATTLGIAALRLLIGATFLAGVVVVGEGWCRRPERAWWPWIVLGAAGVGAYQLTFFAGTERTGVAVGTVVAIGSAPVAGGLIGWWVDGHRPARTWSLGTAIALVGIVALAGRPGAGGVDLDGIGLACAAGAGASYAVYALAARRVIAAGCPSSRTMAYVFGLAGLVAAPALAVEPLGWLAEPAGVGVLAQLSIVTIGVAYVLFGRGVGALPLGVVMTTTLVEPSVAAFLGVAVLGESLGVAGAVGLVLVLAGVAFASRP